MSAGLNMVLTPSLILTRIFAKSLILIFLDVTVCTETANTAKGGPREDKYKIHWLPGNIAEGSRDRWQGVGGLL